MHDQRTTRTTRLHDHVAGSLWESDTDEAKSKNAHMYSVACDVRWTESRAARSVAHL